MTTYRDPSYDHHKGRTIELIMLAVLVLAVGGAFVFGWLHQHRHHTTAKLAATLQQKSVARGISTRMLFVGDVNWARKTEQRAKASQLKYDYITSGLTRTDRDSYDAWIANFECPITTNDVPYALQVSALKFNCRPEYLANLSKWFTAASLANNHTANSDGMTGLNETRQQLQKNGIQYFGSYDMSQTDDLCEVISMPAHLTGTSQKVALPFALCGYMYVVDATPTDAQLAVMRQYSKVMPVIAMPHMGIEYRTTAEPEKVSAYHRMIDNGADAVIGAHPHVIQNSENYKGRLIVYSEGNFLFDQQSLGRNTTLGLGVAINLSLPASTATTAYTKAASDCAAYKDSCLAKLQAEHIVRPKIMVAYNFTCYDESSNVPTKGSAAICAEATMLATTDQLAGLSKQW